MIHLLKTESTELQALLDSAKECGKKGKEQVYREGPVYEQIKADFREKCYLCEDDEATSIQMEHFEPHKGDRDKKYDWNNLFYSCGHCNNLKGDRYWPLLNCTKEEDFIWESVELRFSDFPKAKIEVIPHARSGKEVECENTCKLLKSTLNGENTTAIKKDEAAKLRRKMLRVHRELSRAVSASDLERVQELISDEAPFAGMQRWTLKNEFPALYEKLNQ